MRAAPWFVVAAIHVLGGVVPTVLLALPGPPSPPIADPLVQSRLELSEAALTAHRPDEALDAADGALRAASAVTDDASRALAQRARARALDALLRFEEACGAWHESASWWERAAYGIGRVDALCGEIVARFRVAPADAAAGIEVIVAAALAERAEPEGAARTVLGTATTLLAMGWFDQAAALAGAASQLAESRALDPLILAQSSSVLGAVQRERGETVAAEETVRHALVIAEANGPGTEALAATLEELGLVLLSKEDRIGAKDAFTRSLAIREGLAPSSEAVARCLGHLAEMERVMGHQLPARDRLLRARTIEEREAPYSLQASRTLRQLAFITKSEGDLEEARALIRRSLEMTEHLAPQSIRLADDLNELGVYTRNPDPSIAREFFLRALSVLETFERDSVRVAFTLSFLQALAETDSARREYRRRALEIFERRAPGSVGHVRLLNRYGLEALERGDLAAGRDYTLRAIEVQDPQAPYSVYMGVLLGNLAGVAIEQGDLDAAQRLQELSHDIRVRDDPRSIMTALSFSGLGEIAQLRGDLAAAEEFYRRAYEIRSSIAPRDWNANVSSLTELGEIARERGDLASARERLSRALEIREQVRPGSSLVAEGLLPFGDLARDEGNPAAARAYYARALELWDRDAPASLYVARASRSLGALERDSGELDPALRHLQRAWDILRRQIGGVAGDDARRAFAARYTAVSTELAAVLVALGKPAAAFQAVEEGRARALLESIAVRGLEQALPDETLWSAYRTAESAFEDAEERLTEAAAEEERLERAAITTPEDSEVLRARAARSDAASDYTRARLEMERRLVEIKRAVPGLEAEPLALERARAALPSGSVFLSFAVAENETVVFLMPAAADLPIQAYALPVGQRQLERSVLSFRDQIGKEADTRAFGSLEGDIQPGATLDKIVSAGHELFETLVPAAARPTLSRATRVIISPDGALWELPFAALPTEITPRGPRWLGLEKPLSYAPSLTVLAQVEQRPRNDVSSGCALVVGDPTFGIAPSVELRGAVAQAAAAPADGSAHRPVVRVVRGERSYFDDGGKPPAPLPSTRREATEVAQIYNTQPLLGAAATEAAVRARLPGAAVVHLATHGYFHPTLGLSSGVLLTPPSSPPGPGETDDDGVLQAWEFGPRLPLRANLVVLSACETGRGQEARGEGLVGLTRALLAAGASSVVATQWKVADDASSDLMVTFHRKLRDGLARDEALRAAMLAIESKTETSHPFYWAAFVLSGATDAGVANGTRSEADRR